MSANRNQYFYEEDSLTASFKGNAFDLNFTTRQLRLAVTGGDMECILTGPDDSRSDGTIKDGENIPFDGLETQKIAVKGTGTYRIFAYK